MNIRKQYKAILHQIEDVCKGFDLTQSNNLLKIVKMTKLKDRFNCIDFWDMFEPNVDKPYSILNTDRESDPGNGTHFVGCYQDNNVLYLYDSFSRKHVMDEFCEVMRELGYRCIYVNKKCDQQNTGQDCGLRSLLWLLFVQKYGIIEGSKI